jgi:hypothetical protein
MEAYNLARLPVHQELGRYEARAYLQGRFAVFDVRPANCARSPSGLIVPFDVIPQVFGHADAVILSELR